MPKERQGVRREEKAENIECFIYFNKRGVKFTKNKGFQQALS